MPAGSADAQGSQIFQLISSTNNSAEARLAGPATDPRMWLMPAVGGLAVGLRYDVGVLGSSLGVRFMLASPGNERNNGATGGDKYLSTP